MELVVPAPSRQTELAEARDVYAENSCGVDDTSAWTIATPSWKVAPRRSSGCPLAAASASSVWSL